MFDHFSKHLKVCRKLSATHHILGVWKCGQTRSFVFDKLLIRSCCTVVRRDYYETTRMTRMKDKQFSHMTRTTPRTISLESDRKKKDPVRLDLEPNVFPVRPSNSVKKYIVAPNNLIPCNVWEINL